MINLARIICLIRRKHDCNDYDVEIMEMHTFPYLYSLCSICGRGIMIEQDPADPDAVLISER